MNVCKIKVVIIVILLLVLLTFLALFINSKLNQNVFLKEYTFCHKKIPSAFDGCKLFVIADLHQADFAGQIIEHIKKTKPDYVLMLGDMAQLPHASIDKTLEIAKAVVGMDIPIFAVSGNHERQGDHYDEIIETLWAFDVYMLENGSFKLEKGDQSIFLVGIKDPLEVNPSENRIKIIRGNINFELGKEDEDIFTILLSHRADIYPRIKDLGVDLILSGHMHGGIARLPIVGGLIGKSDEYYLFPRYDYGVFKEDDGATMIVSGGCDNNPEKKRYFNPPEVLLITLKGE